MIRLLLSTSTKLTEWDIVAKKINSNKKTNVVGQISPHSGRVQSKDWVFINSNDLDHEYLRNVCRKGKGNTIEGIESKAIVKGLLNRDIWKYLAEEYQKVFKYFVKKWISVIQSTKPDIVVFDGTPHLIFDYALYWVAKKKEIRTILFSSIPETNYIFTRDSIFYDEDADKRLFPEAIDKKKPPKEIKDIITNKKKNYKKGKPKYKKEKEDNIPKSYPKLENVFKFLLSSLYRPKLVTKYITDKVSHRKFWIKKRKKYKQLSITPALDSEYIYIPLHFQPERTTSPEGGKFVNQIKLIRLIRKANREKTKLYVKEHPSQFRLRNGWLGRSNNYYEQILHIDDTRLISLDADPFDLIDNAKCVISVAGTSSLEAIVRGTPASISGYPWYYPGMMYHTRDYRSMSKFLEEALHNMELSKSRLFSFLHSIIEVSLRGYTKRAHRTDQVSKAECVDNIFKLIYKEIN